MSDRERLIDIILNLTDEEEKLLLSHWDEILRPEPIPGDKCYYHRFIYSIKCNETGKEYIGRTEDYERRIKYHMSRLQNGKHPIRDMQSDFDKYRDSFRVSVLEETTSVFQRDREYELIESHKSYLRENGYNYNDRIFKKWRDSKNRQCKEETL